MCFAHVMLILDIINSYSSARVRNEMQRIENFIVGFPIQNSCRILPEVTIQEIILIVPT